MLHKPCDFITINFRELTQILGKNEIEESPILNIAYEPSQLPEKVLVPSLSYMFGQLE